MEGQLKMQEILAILHKWGVHTLGQLAALDKEQLGVRLGPEAIRMWERANGRSIRLLNFIQPPESFEESFEFEQEIATAEPLLFMLRRFLEQLAVRLSSIYLVAKQLTLRITFASKQNYERVFKIPQPTINVDLLFRMLQTHLENFRSEHPIIAVSLSAEPIKPAGEQFGLFETTLRNPHQLSETLARLTALLGPERIGTPVLQETHRPDGFYMQPFLSTDCQFTTASVLPSKSNGRQNPSLPHSQPVCAPLRPSLRRFRPAPSVSVFFHKEHPAHLRSAEISGKILDQRGPYFLSGSWWDQNSWARAERDFQLQDGELVRCHESEGEWRIDGIYD